MLLSVVSVLVVAQSSSEVPEGFTNNPVVNYPGMKNSSVEQILNQRRTRSNSWQAVYI